MAEYHESQLITLDNLNQVYRDVRERIDRLGNIYHAQGSLTWADLMKLDKVEGSNVVYNITLDSGVQPGNYPKDSKSTPVEEIVNGTNVLCIQTFTSPIDPNKWSEYWDVLGGVLEEASDTNMGVIQLGSEIASKENTNTGDVYRGLNLYRPSSSVPEEADIRAKPHQAYITMPIASKETYGVVSTGPQELAGNKIFNSDVIFEGNVTIPNTNVQQINKLAVNSIELNGIKITAQDNKIIFGPRVS